MSAVELTDVELQVFFKLIDAGALTTRAVIAQFGPKPNWTRLLEYKFLQEVETNYGSVIGIGRVGRTHVEEIYPDKYETLPYLTGSSSLANRAYQQDALHLLLRTGYTIYRHQYQRASPMILKHRDSKNPWTSQIISTSLRVPEFQAEKIEQHWGQRVKQSHEIIGVAEYENRIGYPLLYATISGGGLSIKKVEALYQEAQVLSSEWRTFMIVVVPNINEHRDVLRKIEAKQRDEKKLDRVSSPPTFFGTYPVMRIIERPLPNRVRRKSG